MSDMWVVVADSSAARLFRARGLRGPLTLLDTLSHPESRVHANEVYTDSAHERRGATRQAVEVRTDLHTEEAQRFARQIAGRLGREHRLKKFRRLIVMAPPAFLGALRGAFGKSLRRSVVVEVPKNLVAQDEAQIAGHMP